MMSRDEMGDPYQAPQADLRVASSAGRPNGSVPKAVGLGLVTWILLYLLSSFGFIFLQSNSTFRELVFSNLRWIGFGISLVICIAAFYLASRIAYRREWPAAGILFAIKVAIWFGFSILLLRTTMAFSPEWLMQACGAVAGTLAGIWANRKREKEAVIQ